VPDPVHSIQCCRWPTAEPAGRMQQLFVPRSEALTPSTNTQTAGNSSIALLAGSTGTSPRLFSFSFSTGELGRTPSALTKGAVLGSAGCSLGTVCKQPGRRGAARQGGCLSCQDMSLMGPCSVTLLPLYSMLELVDVTQSASRTQQTGVQGRVAFDLG
jgi:hypothetical protein